MGIRNIFKELSEVEILTRISISGKFVARVQETFPASGKVVTRVHEAFPVTGKVVASVQEIFRESGKPVARVFGTFPMLM
ncbi:hypothetical protein SAMN05421846_104273 [Chryseobacterium taeanense]|uniref:Uncharacterized protein n=1 Tax=Chryseobacterium taeanense TaxID=311334 RepID=A0A1G8I9S7_9FLAO|nr:hypothetical protein [Chryseobacterium taeanense]SDI15634.1 hypothetical protein SAMN05421846_104273 [Chryseobacterium taeanense]